MCDRFAARVLVDEYHCPLRNSSGLPVPREAWDFSDVTGFVQEAPRNPQMVLPLRSARFCS